jgi:hypothetical protein
MWCCSMIFFCRSPLRTHVDTLVRILPFYVFPVSFYFRKRWSVSIEQTLWNIFGSYIAFVNYICTSCAEEYDCQEVVSCIMADTFHSDMLQDAIRSMGISFSSVYTIRLCPVECRLRCFALPTSHSVMHVKLWIYGTCNLKLVSICG